MPTRRRTRRRTPRPTRENNFIVYFLIVVLALSLLIWVISLIPVQVWIYLLIIAGLLALVVIVGATIFLVRRSQRQMGEAIVSVTPSPRQRRRATTSSSTYQQGYRGNNDQAFWHDMKNFNTRGHLFNLTPTQFEIHCGRVLEALGYQVNHVGRPRDRGVDLRAIDPNGKKVIAQCKQHNIGIKANSGEFQKLVGAMDIDQAEMGIFITTSEFTSEVIALNNERKNKIHLIDGKKLIQIMHQVQSLQDQNKEPL